MELIQNCPEAWAHYYKGCRQNKTGTILLISGGSLIVVGSLITLISGGNDGTGGLFFGAVLGGATALASIPFYIAGSKKKNNAYQVYNEYCSKPTASLSFGPATQGIGMGVYLNF